MHKNVLGFFSSYLLVMLFTIGENAHAAEAMTKQEPNLIRVKVRQMIDKCEGGINSMFCDVTDIDTTEDIEITKEIDGNYWDKTVDFTYEGHIFKYRIFLAKDTYETNSDYPYSLVLGIASTPAQWDRNSSETSSIKVLLAAPQQLNPILLPTSMFYPNGRGTETEDVVFYRHFVWVISVTVE